MINPGRDDNYPTSSGNVPAKLGAGYMPILLVILIIAVVILFFSHATHKHHKR